MLSSQGNMNRLNLKLKPIIFDEGSSSSFSDSLSNRPKMRELLIEVEEGKVQNLWIYQLFP